jgi:hypothetical protein
MIGRIASITMNWQKGTPMDVLFTINGFIILSEFGLYAFSSTTW